MVSQSENTKKILGGVQRRDQYPKNLLVNNIYAGIRACIVSSLKVGACMVFMSENTRVKFEVESKAENNIQQIF